MDHGRSPRERGGDRFDDRPRDDERREHRGGPSRDRGPRDDRGGGERRGGGPDTRFLELEMSQLLYEEASGTTREALRELLRDGVKQRLRERLGDRIDALARLAADELVDMIEANLAIEARIDDYNDGRRDARERLRDILAPQRRPSPESKERPEGPERPERKAGGGEDPAR